MAAARGGKGLALIDRLLRDPQRFDFFQAVRILERWYDERARRDARERRNPVGHDDFPGAEIVRFQAAAALSFPASTIASLGKTSGRGRLPGANEPPLDMQVAFIGLTGPQGVLPRHYTTLLLTRLKEKDESLRDFFDLFNHRTTSFFYRAWEKYRFPVAYERARLEREEARDDFFTSCLYCLVGYGTGGLRNRQSVSDEVFLYYSGIFAHQPRPVINLERMIADYFGLPTEVLQFHGQWMYLPLEDQTRMPTRARPLGVNCQLGVNAIAGERIWDVQSKVRIRLGPLKYKEFAHFQPTGGGLLQLCELARNYLGVEFDFDVQPVLLASEIPACHLSQAAPAPPRLGWNTWMLSKPATKNAEDPVFHLDLGLPDGVA